MTASDPLYDAGKYWTNQGEPEKAVAWRRAFMAYCEGMSLKEISDGTGLTYDALRAKAQPSGDDWGAARQKLVMSRVDSRVALTDKIEQQVQRIKHNREQNLRESQGLRNVLSDIVSKLEAGTLTFKKPLNTKLGPILFEAPPSPQELVLIATFARIVADMTYRALGDVSESRTKPDATPHSTNSSQGITVILPQVAVEPRPKKGRASVVDIETVEPVITMPETVPDSPPDEPTQASGPNDPPAETAPAAIPPSEPAEQAPENAGT